MRNLRNSVQLIGNIGQNPEVRSIGDNATKVARFSVATNNNYKNAEGKRVTQTQWHNIVAWGTKAEFAEKYLAKGSLVALEGKLQTRTYETSGEKRYITEIVLNDVQMIGPKPVPQAV